MQHGALPPEARHVGAVPEEQLRHVQVARLVGQVQRARAAVVAPVRGMRMIYISIYIILALSFWRGSQWSVPLQGNQACII